VSAGDAGGRGDGDGRRVVVTGLGMVSPIGNSVETSWEALIAGRSGAGPITRFDARDYPTRFACEVTGLEVTDYVDHKTSRRMDRCTHLAVAAARQAEADSGLDVKPIGERVGTAVATAMGGVEAFEDCVVQLNARGPRRVSPFSVVQIIPNLSAGWVSMELGTRGPLLSQSSACAASNMAIGDGLDAIRLGRHDPRPRTRHPAAHDQPDHIRPGLRPRLHRQPGTRRTRRDRHLELVRLRRPQHLPRLPTLATEPRITP
jgi:3-oxoacyl-[acyl-carrier-protein] synthase II